MNRKLTIYCHNGETLRFEKIEKASLPGEEGILRFRYTSASRDVVGAGVFSLANIAGYTVDEE